MLHSTSPCVPVGRYLAASSSQTSPEAETVDHSCSAQMLLGREAFLLTHTYAPTSCLHKRTCGVCLTSPENSTRIPLLEDLQGISGIPASALEEPQAEGGMFVWIPAAHSHQRCCQAVSSRRFQWCFATFGCLSLCCPGFKCLPVQAPHCLAEDSNGVHELVVVFFLPDHLLHCSLVT